MVTDACDEAGSRRGGPPDPAVLAGRPNPVLAGPRWAPPDGTRRGGQDLSPRKAPSRGGGRSRAAWDLAGLLPAAARPGRLRIPGAQRWPLLAGRLVDRGSSKAGGQGLLGTRPSGGS